MQNEKNAPQERNAETLKRRLSKKDVEVFRYAVTGSTNDRAKEFAKTSQGRDAIFVADEQTSGRGRLGRSFVSKKGAGLYISFLVSENTLRERGCADPLTETARAAVILAESIEALCPDLRPAIKWVNDLLINKKKVAGILAEGVISPEGKLSALVVGIGVNLLPQTFEGDLSNTAASLGDFTAPPSADALAAELAERFFGERTPWIDGYRARLSYVGKPIELIGDHTEQAKRERATLLGVTDEGHLRVRDALGREHVISSGEISIRPFAD